MEIKMVPIGELKPSEYNPRKISDSQMEKLKDSVRKYGMVEPILANSHAGRENVVVGGHQRLKAAEQVGLNEVPVLFLDLDETRERLLNLGLNKIRGEWENGLLSEMLIELQEEGADVGLTGFEQDELKRLIGDYGVRQDEEDVQMPTFENKCEKCGYEF